MAILSDKTILRYIEESKIKIEPEIHDSQIQPASLDIRLGDSYSNEHTGELFENCDEIVIEPFTFYLAHTKDTIDLPDDLSSIIAGRSSHARNGLIIHTTAGWIDANFRGQITLEMFNFSMEPIILTPGERIGQMVFFEMTTPAEEPYGEKEDSKYQDQTGPTQSRIEDEK